MTDAPDRGRERERDRERDREPTPTTDYAPLAADLAARDAAAFVHVADGADPDLRYLTRLPGPDRPFAFVHLAPSGDAGDDGRTVLLAPSLYDAAARRTFPGDEVVGAGDPVPGRGGDAGDGADAGAHPAERAAALVRAATDVGERPVLVPRQLPHDAAVYLDRAGLAVASTDAVRRARVCKTDAERAAVARAQAAAVAGVDRAAAILDAAEVVDADVDAPPLAWRDGRVTTGRLRRAVDAALAGVGVDPAGNTVVASGPACADLHYRGDRPVRAGETVLVDASPRGPAGYHGDCTRTFVVAGGGGWERRAHVAVTAARRAGLAAIEPGVPARSVHEEVAAELAAYGFPATYGADEGFVHAAGHGIGLALHEASAVRSDATIEAGATIALEPGVYDPDVGGVRVEDVVVVTDDGPELLAPYPTGLTPAPEGRAGDGDDRPGWPDEG